jgi:hypothetical protein
MEGNQGRPRGIVNGAICKRDQWWTEAFTDLNLDPLKPHTELVTRQGNRVYVVKWTPELPRPEPTQEAGDQPLGSTKGGPQLIYTREQSPSMRPLRTSPPDASQPGGAATVPRRHWSRGVGGRDRPSDEPQPHRGSRAGVCLPSAGQVASPSHATADDGAPKLGRNAQRRCPTLGAAAGRPHSCGGTAPRAHHEAHPVDPSRLARQQALPTGAVCRSAGGVRSRGGGSHTAAVLG